MILTCPQCASRFLTPARAIGAKGRKVKCSSCAETWFQEPDEETLSEIQEQEDETASVIEPEDESPALESEVEVEEVTEPEPEAAIEDASVEDIPEGVKPAQEEALDFEFVERKSIFARALLFFRGEPIALKQRAGGYGAAAVLFVLTVFVFSVFQAPLVKAWPASAGFYKVFGIQSKLSGQGLIFDDLMAEIEGDEIKISGQVVNLYKKPQDMPPVLITVHAEGQKVLERWFVTLPQGRVESEQIIPFSLAYVSKHLKDAEALKVKFVLKVEEETPDPS